MAYDALHVSDWDRDKPDGDTESPNILDDAIREIKNCVHRSCSGARKNITTTTVGVTTDFFIEIDTTSEAIDYQLPRCERGPKIFVLTWSAGANAARMTLYGSDTIGGSATPLTLSVVGEVYVMINDGVDNWTVAARYYTGIEAAEDSVLVVRQKQTTAYHNPTGYTGLRFFSNFNTVEKNSISGSSVETTDEANDSIALPQGDYIINGWVLASARVVAPSIEKVDPSYEARVIFGGYTEYPSLVFTSNWDEFTKSHPINGFLTIDAGGETIRLTTYYSGPGTYKGGYFKSSLLSGVSDKTFATLSIKKIG